MRTTLHGNDVAFFDDFFRVVDAAVDKLRDMDQAFDWAFEPDEGAERRELRYLAGDDLALAIAGDDLLPALGLGAADAEGDLLALVIHLQDVDGDSSPALNSSWGEFGVRSQESSERWTSPSAPPISTKMPKSRMLVMRPVLMSPSCSSRRRRSLSAARFSCMAARSERMARLRRRLSSMTLRVMFLPTHWASACCVFSGEPRSGRADELRERDESVDALDVDEEAALVAAGDIALEGFVLVEVVLEHAPASLAAGAVEREDDLAFGRLGLDDEDEDLVALVEPGRAFGLKAVHLVGRDYAFGLCSYINENPIAIGADDDPFDDFSAAEFRVGGGLFFEEGGHRLFFARRSSILFFR